MTRRTIELIHWSRTTLQNPYAYLDGEGAYDALLPERPRIPAIVQMGKVLDGRDRRRAFSRLEIERIVRNLHTEMWLQRMQIFQSDREVDPMWIVDPELALRTLGYSVNTKDSLGQHMAGRDSFEVAGVVDKTGMKVDLSLNFSPAVRNFTAAHELGHVVLHESSGLHRDRGIDGGAFGTRDPQEMEADIFAAFFLMPAKQVLAAFRSRFLAETFKLNEATAFALNLGSLGQLQRNCRTARDLARKLAAAQHYNGTHFRSMFDAFGVSKEAMAIRLEELGLVAVV